MPDTDTAQLQVVFMGELRSALRVEPGSEVPTPGSQPARDVPLPVAVQYPPDRFFGDPGLVERALDYLGAVAERYGSEDQPATVRALATLSAILGASSTGEGDALQARAAAFADRFPAVGEVRSLYGDRIPPDSRWLRFIDNLYFAGFSKDDRELLRLFIGQHQLYRIPLGRDTLRDRNDVVALELLLGLPQVRNPNSAHASALKDFLSQLFERFSYSVLNFRDNDSVAIADLWVLDEDVEVVRSEIRVFLDKPEDITDVVKTMGKLANRSPFNQITIHFRGTEEDMLRLARLTEPFMKAGPEGDRYAVFYQPGGPLHGTFVSLRREVVGGRVWGTRDSVQGRPSLPPPLLRRAGVAPATTTPAGRRRPSTPPHSRPRSPKGSPLGRGPLSGRAGGSRVIGSSHFKLIAGGKREAPKVSAQDPRQSGIFLRAVQMAKTLGLTAVANYLETRSEAEALDLMSGSLIEIRLTLIRLGKLDHASRVEKQKESLSAEEIVILRAANDTNDAALILATVGKLIPESPGLPGRGFGGAEAGHVFGTPAGGAAMMRSAMPVTGR